MVRGGAHRERLPYEVARSVLACHPFGCPSRLPSALNSLISIAMGGSRMKMAVAIVIAVVLLSVAIVATQRHESVYSTVHTGGLVVCDGPTSGDRGPSCRLLLIRTSST